MLKGAGLLLMIAAGIGFGFSKSLALTRREQDLKAIRQMVLLLNGEIAYGNASLHDAFLEAGRKLSGTYGAFLQELARRMEAGGGVPFFELYGSCAKEMLSGWELSREEQEAFLTLGRNLGYLNLDMQMKQLKLYEREVEYSIEKLQAELPAKKKVYQSLGILGGLMLAVLFL